MFYYRINKLYNAHEFNLGGSGIASILEVVDYIKIFTIFLKRKILDVLIVL